MSNARNIASIAGEDVLNASNEIVPVYACRAWVNFDGTTNTAGFCTIRDSENVSTVADNGTGDYTVTFVTAMPDANYCVTASTGGNCLGVSGHAPANGHTLATGSMRVTCGTPSANFDPSFVHFAVFR